MQKWTNSCHVYNNHAIYMITYVEDIIVVKQYQNIKVIISETLSLAIFQIIIMKFCLQKYNSKQGK